MTSVTPAAIAGNVHYRRSQRIMPGSRLDEALDIMGMEPGDLLALGALFSLFTGLVGFIVGVTW